MVRFKKAITVIYILILAVVVLLFINAAATNTKENTVRSLMKDATEVSTGWVTASGLEVNLDSLQDYCAAEQTSIFHTLPESIADDDTFAFFAHHIFYEVWIDGNFIYEEEVPEHFFYNEGPGHCWCFIDLDEECAGKQIEIRYICGYPEQTGYLSDVYVGNERGITLKIISERFVPLVASLFLLFLGVIFVVADFPINIGQEKSHELLYLGLLAVSFSVWTIAELQLIQLFTGNSRMIHILACSSLMFIPLPTILYAEETMPMKNPIIPKILCVISVIQYFVCITLNVTNVMDMKDTLWVSHVLIGISSIYVLIAIVRSLRNNDKYTNFIFKSIRVIGISTFILTSLIDLTRYYNETGNDSALFVRIGLLIFVLCYGCASLERTVEMVKKGAKAEIISKLAYQDGLTGIGNRTAFQETLQSLEQMLKKEADLDVGIILFDLNDLKKTNDKYGHQIGDQMIVETALAMKEAFIKTGKCYRIGGDEFSVILQGKDVKNKAEEGIKAFDALLKTYNEEAVKPYRLSVARGVAYYNKNNENEKLDDVYKTADEKMYENKKAMKA